MGIFDKFVNKSSYDSSTTKFFYLGAPEAEAESASSSSIRLDEVFEDYLEILPELNTAKFILSGRKGSGKTAIAEHIYFKANSDPNLFCEFIKKGDLDIEKIVQVGKDLGTHLEYTFLYEWIILVKIIELLCYNENAKETNKFSHLQKFLEKNSGFVNIKSYEVKQVFTSTELQVNIEHLRRFFNSSLSKKFDIKGERAPFYKIIPHLKTVIQEVLTSDEDKDNSYVLIFDDLDVGFKAQEEEDIDILAELLRVVKRYNIEFFGKNNIDAKILLLIRDDISRILIESQADTAKIFSSYCVNLIWYEHDIFKLGENQTMLKKFINERIKVNLDKNKIEQNKVDPWSTLINENSNEGEKSTFKYVLDNTFYRPRDLILFFKPLPDFGFRIPLGPYQLNKLIEKYSVEVYNEIKNELNLFFNNNEFRLIEGFLEYLYRQNSLKYNEIISYFRRCGLDNPEETIKLLFDYSLIGNIDYEHTIPKIYFKYRETRDERSELDKNLKFIVHNAVKNYFKKTNHKTD